MDKELAHLREKIDSIDDQLIALLNQRMELVRAVGRLKRTNRSIIYRPEREQAILERLKANNKGLLMPQAIDSIFLEIFAVSRNFELPERIAYLGPEGSFTHQAAESRFGSIADYLSLPTIQEVFESVGTERVRFGVLPIENNQEGTVNETFEGLYNNNIKIVAEVPMPIHFTFASAEDRLPHIEKVYSKDIAFRQCKKFLQSYFEHQKVELIPVESTSKAALLASKELNSAAICSPIAARIHQLPILFNNIEDSDFNRTRFLVISKDFKLPMSKGCKTSIIAKVADQAGALASFLQDFYQANINLCKIDSRPAKEQDGFKYWFWIEFDGHEDEPAVQNILARHAHVVRCLGSYIKLC
ncbi:MAG: chorismate mutase [Cytophagales bacterium]|nr:MAG: chorismate mutase [Cytophagales bacterium]